MNENSQVSIGDISQKMRSIFGRMQMEHIPYSTFRDAINRNPLNISSFLDNPFVQNNRIKRSNTPIGKLNRVTVSEALQDPANNESAIRQASMALFYNNYVYQNLIRLNRDVPQFFNYVTPINVDSDVENDKLLKQQKFVETFLQAFNVPLTFKNVSLQVAREGKCSYVFRSSQDVKKGIVDFAVLQKLPPEYVKYTGFGSESPLIVSFNFACFLDPTYSITQWPSWFGEIWQQLQEAGIVNINKNGKNGYEINPMVKNKNNLPDYMFESINGTYYLYVEMPQDLVYTFGSDFGDALAIPEYAGLFEDLSDLDAYKTLQQQTLLTNITNILTAEVPVEKDATGGSDAAILSPEVIMGLEGDCSASLNSNIFPFFAPLQNFKMHTIDHIPNAQDIVLDTVRNITSTAGVSGLINTNDKPSVAMIKGEQMLIESKMEYYTLQYMKFLNLIINKYLGLDYKFKVIIWGGVYNWKEEVKVLKEMIQNGHKGFLPRLLSAYRMTVTDYVYQYQYIDSLNIIPESNISRNQSSGPVGRPALDDVDIDNDNTANSKDQGGNVSDVK